MGSCCAKQHHKRQPTKGRMISQAIASKFSRLDSKSQSDISNYYSFQRVIGYGQFGTVRQASRILQGGPSSSFMSNFAIKSVQKSKISKDIAMIRKELEILHKVDHPNIVRLYQVFEDEKYIHMVMELCNGSDVFQRLMERGRFTQNEVSTLMMKLLSAVQHLHTLHICHRDLKPENIMYLTNEAQSEIKLADFGMSSKFQSTRMKTMVGTPYYLAPEILTGNYGKECDIWSLGVIIFFLLSGQQPFDCQDLKSLMRRVKNADYSFNGPRWQGVSANAKDLISKMLVVSPSQRVRIGKALNHPWFRENRRQGVNLVTPQLISSIRKYKAPSKLFQQTLKVLVKNLNQEQIHYLEQAFHQLDHNRSGYITAKDIEIATKTSGFRLAHRELSQLMKTIEYIGQGQLNYTQFIMCAIDKRKFFDDESLWYIFEYFDTVRFRQGHTGVIRVEDLRFALERAGCVLSNQEYEEIVVEFKLQAGNEMNFEEFKQVLNCEFQIGFSEQNSPDNSPIGMFERRGTRRLSQKKRQAGFQIKLLIKNLC